MPTISLTDEDGVTRSVRVGTIAFTDRNYDGGSFITFKDGSKRLFREEPDEVSRRIDEANGVPGTMPTQPRTDNPGTPFGMEGMI